MYSIAESDAARILGSRQYLEALVKAGKITMQPDQNGQQFYNQREIDSIWKGEGLPAGQLSLENLAKLLALVTEAPAWLPALLRSKFATTALRAYAGEISEDDINDVIPSVDDPFTLHCVKAASVQRNREPYRALSALVDTLCRTIEGLLPGLVSLVVEATHRAYTNFESRPLKQQERKWAAQLVRAIACGRLLYVMTIGAIDSFTFETTLRYPHDIICDPARWDPLKRNSTYESVAELFVLAEKLDGIAPPRELQTVLPAQAR